MQIDGLYPASTAADPIATAATAAAADARCHSCRPLCPLGRRSGQVCGGPSPAGVLSAARGTPACSVAAPATAAGSGTIDQLDFVGELNGSSNLGNDSSSSSLAAGSGGGGGGISFGENEVRTFETDSSERKNEYMSNDNDDADDDDDSGSGRLNIGGDIRLDTLDIHTLNESQELNAPPLLDDIEVLA